MYHVTLLLIKNSFLSKNSFNGNRILPEVSRELSPAPCFLKCWFWSNSLTVMKSFIFSQLSTCKFFRRLRWLRCPYLWKVLFHNSLSYSLVLRTFSRLSLQSAVWKSFLIRFYETLRIIWDLLTSSFSIIFSRGRMFLQVHSKFSPRQNISCISVKISACFCKMSLSILCLRFSLSTSSWKLDKKQHGPSPEKRADCLSSCWQMEEITALSFQLGEWTVSLLSWLSFWQNL